MDIKKYFYLALTFLIIELLLALFMIVAGQKSDPAGKAMGQGLGMLGILLVLLLSGLLYYFFLHQIKGAVITILIISFIPVLYTISFELKYVTLFNIDKYSTKRFENGKGVFPKGKPTEMAIAIAHNDIEKINALAKEKTDLEILNKDSLTYLQYAIKLSLEHEKPADPVKTLLKSGVDPNHNAPIISAFHSAGKGSLPIFEALLAAGANPNQMDEYEVAMLHNCKDINKLKLLVKYGADVNNFNNYWTFKGYTPVMSLINIDGWEQILFLLEQGANRDHIAEDGETLKSLLIRNHRAFISSGSKISESFEKVLVETGIKSIHSRETL